MRKILIVGVENPGGLEISYKNAFEKNSCECIFFDMKKNINANARLAVLGRFFNKFVPVEAWIRKANRDLFLFIKKNSPDLIVVVGQTFLLPGTHAQINSSFGIKTILIWQDSLTFMATHTIASLPQYDKIYTYSQNSIPSIRKFGGRSVSWLPLAADLQLHHPLSVELQGGSLRPVDLSFIGQWRPEREYWLEQIIKEVPNIKLEIYGVDWKRRLTKKSSIYKYCKDKAVYGEEFSRICGESKLCLNVIDETNFPAANMRFFEIPASAGVQVSTECPELEDIFLDWESIIYLKRVDDIREKLKPLLSQPNLCKKIRESAYSLVLNSNTYMHRAQFILNDIDSNA
jgi:hypothetical protein